MADSAVVPQRYMILWLLCIQVYKLQFMVVLQKCLQFFSTVAKLRLLQPRRCTQKIHFRRYGDFKVLLLSRCRSLCLSPRHYVPASRATTQFLKGKLWLTIWLFADANARDAQDASEIRFYELRIAW